MKMVARNHQKISCGIFLTALIFILTSSATGIAQTKPLPAWGITKISQQKSNKQYSRGLLLFTTDAQNTGAAFRCEGGKLYTFMAVKPTDFRKIIQQRSPHPSDREISFRINSGTEVAEKWVQMFRGQIYMVHEISTTHDIFQAATTGATITFKRKYGKTVTIPLPVLEPYVFEHFLDSCKLSANYSPGLVATP